MRTTLTLDNDVADLAREVADATGRAFKEIINDALRRGLPDVKKPKKLPPYRTEPDHMGVPLMPLDNIQEVLARLDGEDAP